MRTFKHKWLPFPYNAWGVIVYDEETRMGIIPAYYCNTPDARELAEKHAKHLESEYQEEFKP